MKATEYRQQIHEMNLSVEKDMASLISGQPDKVVKFENKSTAPYVAYDEYDAHGEGYIVASTLSRIFLGDDGKIYFEAEENSCVPWSRLDLGIRVYLLGEVERKVKEGKS